MQNMYEHYLQYVHNLTLGLRPMALGRGIQALRLRPRQVRSVRGPEANAKCPVRALKEMRVPTSGTEKGKTQHTIAKS